MPLTAFPSTDRPTSSSKAAQRVKWLFQLKVGRLWHRATIIQVIHFNYCRIRSALGVHRRVAFVTACPQFRGSLHVDDLEGN